MSWRVYCSGLALLLLTGAFLLTDRLLYPPGPTERNVRRIRPGMTLATVEGLLGGRATRETTLDELLCYSPPLTITAEEYVRYSRWRWWDGLAGKALVYFSLDGKVTEARFEPTSFPRLLDRLRSEGQP